MSTKHIQATRCYRCETREHRKPLTQTNEVAMPKKLCFNLETMKKGTPFFLNIVCQGTTLQRVIC
eukprot:420559-Pyramimonas_sp.AAC.1